MKRFIPLFMIAILALASFSSALGESLLPSLDDTFGVEMPSMSHVLLRVPDSITDNTGVREVTFNNVSEHDFDRWSIYLNQFGCELLDYNTIGSVFTAIVGKSGKQLTFSYDNTNCIMTLSYLEGTIEENVNIQEIQNKILPFKTVGGIVTFGRYEQDNDYANGQEPIEWIVLDVEDGRSLLISKDAIEKMLFGEQYTDGQRRWDECYLRDWLNTVFIADAFNDTEIQGIITTKVDNTHGQYEMPHIVDDVDTEDRVFILSTTEAGTYFTSDDARRCKPSEYALNKKVSYKMVSDSLDRKTGFCSWWVRTRVAAWNIGYVMSDGYITTIIGFDGCVFNYIRPVIWLDLGSEYFFK